jgi:hypothetical protein
MRFGTSSGMSSGLSFVRRLQIVLWLELHFENRRLTCTLAARAVQA